MDTFDLYKDIQCRTNGEIYLGVVGPVRSGKSTFIKRFMDVLVLPKMTVRFPMLRLLRLSASLYPKRMITQQALLRNHP